MGLVDKHTTTSVSVVTPVLNSLVPRLEAGLSGTYTANTHPLSLVKFDVESSLIGLIRFYKALRSKTRIYIMSSNYRF